MYVGIDLGGTNIAAGIVDENGNILCEISRPTRSEREPIEIINDMKELILELIERLNLDKKEIDAVGIGIPGLADSNGNVILCVNLGWRDVPFRKILEEELNIPVYMENDATVAALAEYESGAMKNCRNGIMLTIGTGIGGGIILDGRIYTGFNGVGSELGHVVVGENFYDCNCGRNGCLETFSSATALIKYTKKLLEEGNAKSIIYEKIENDLNKLNAEIIFDSAKEGDNIADKAVKRCVKYLGIGIVNIINFIDPEIIVLGGGVANAGEYFLNLVINEVENNKYYKELPIGKIALAQLGNKAGIIGAAMIGKYGLINK